MDLDDPRFAFVLKPIKDLVKNWEIDINTILMDFVHDTVQNGASEVNFAHASVVLQGSVSVWARKVEYVSKLCEQVVELVVFNENQEPGQRSNKGRSKRCESNTIALADPKISERKTCGDDIVTTLKQKRCFHLNLGNQSSSIRGSKLNSSEGYYDSVVNFYDQLSNHVAIAPSSMFCLITTEPPPLHQNDDDGTTPSPNQNDFMSVDMVDDGDDVCGGGDDDDVSMELPMNVDDVMSGHDDVSQQHQQGPPPSKKDVTLLMHTAHGVNKRDRTVIQPPAVEEERNVTFEYFSLDGNCDVDGWKDRPIKLKKSSFINFNKRKSSCNNPNLPTLVNTLRELTGATINENRISKCGLIESKNHDDQKRIRVRQIKSQNRRSVVRRRAPKRKAQKTATDNADDLELDRETEEMIAECIDGQAITHGQLFDNRDDDVDADDDFVSDLNASDLATSLIAKGNGDDDQESYKRLQEYVDQCFREANEKVKRSDIERRVQEWEDRILPYLNSCSKMPSFDIGACSRGVLRELETVMTSPSQYVMMTTLMEGSERWNLARKFASLLQLANDENVELRTEPSTTGSVNTLTIKLVDSRHKDKLSHL